MGVQKVYTVVVLRHLSLVSEICLYLVANVTVLTESPGLALLIGKLLLLLYRAQDKWQHLEINIGGGLTYISYSVHS